MKCSNCGKEVPDDLAFCEGCGAPLSVADTSIETVADDNSDAAPPKPEEIASPEKGDAGDQASDAPEKEAENAKQPDRAAAAASPATRPHNIIYGFGFFAGLAMVIAGMLIAVIYNSDIDTTTRFGADFYTESYQGIAETVQAIVVLTKVCGGILAGLGALLMNTFAEWGEKK